MFKTKSLVFFIFLLGIFNFFSINCFGMHEVFGRNNEEKSYKDKSFYFDCYDERENDVDSFKFEDLALNSIKENILEKEEKSNFSFKPDNIFNDEFNNISQFLQNKREPTLNFENLFKTKTNNKNVKECNLTKNKEKIIEKNEKEKTLKAKEIKIENEENNIHNLTKNKEKIIEKNEKEKTLKAKEIKIENEDDSIHNLIKKQEKVIEQNENFNKFFIEQLNLKNSELNKTVNLKNKQKDILFLGCRYFFNFSNESFKDINKDLKQYYLELFKYMLEKDMINKKNYYPDNLKIYLKMLNPQYKNLNEFLNFYLSSKDDKNIFLILGEFAKNFNNLKRKIKYMNLALKDLDVVKEMFLGSLDELDYSIKENCNESHNEFINNFKDNIKNSVIEKIDKIKDENIYIYFVEIFNYIEAQKNSFLANIKCFDKNDKIKNVINSFNRLRDIFLIDEFKYYICCYKDFLKNYNKCSKDILKLIDSLDLEEFKKIVNGIHNIFETFNVSEDKINFNNNFKFLYNIKLKLKDGFKDNGIINLCNTVLVSLILYNLEKENLAFDVGIINNVYYYDRKENCYALKFDVLPFKEKNEQNKKIENILKNCLDCFNEKNKNIIKSVSLDCVYDIEN